MACIGRLGIAVVILFVMYGCVAIKDKPKIGEEDNSPSGWINYCRDNPKAC